MQITFLGTSCMVPTKERNVTGLFLKYQGEGILFDCGEGTQRQMNITGINRHDVTKILISHWHGDHVGGLMGLLQTLGNRDEPPTIDLFGPKGTKEYIKNLYKSCVFEARVNLRVHEVTPKKVETCFENEDFKILCAPMKHSIPCNGYAFVEKERRKINMAYLEKLGIPEGPHLQKLQEGKSITYRGVKAEVEKATRLAEGKKFTFITDTTETPMAIELAKGSDILATDATYSSKLTHKAKQYRHLTARQAAHIANEAAVGKLYLTHFSQRYKNTQEIEEDARVLFDNVYCANDFMKITL